MGTSVSFKIYRDDGFCAEGEDTSDFVPKYKEGQIIFVQPLQKIYLDFDGKRTCYTPSGLNYVGVSKKDPTNGSVEIDSKPDYQPHEMDMVVYGKKEYMYRGNAWYEIGNEDAPEWN